MVNRRSFIKNAAAGGAAALAGNVLAADAANVKGRVTADGKGMVWATCQDGALYAWDPQTGERSNACSQACRTRHPPRSTRTGCMWPISPEA